MAILPKDSSLVSAYATIEPMVTGVSNGVKSAYVTSQQLLDRYPPLKAFVFALMACSFVPLAVFLGYAAFWGSLVFGGAAVIGTVVQGSILGFGGFFLFWALLASFCAACVVTFWFSVGYFGLKTAKKI